MSEFTKKRIVASVDISEMSTVTVRQAVRLAEDGSQVDVVHVLPETAPPNPQRAAEIQAALGLHLAENGFGDARVSIRFGSPGESIVEFAAEADAGLIVISSHGRTGLQRFVLGSVAEKVVRLAHCPVLVVKPDEQT